MRLRGTGRRRVRPTSALIALIGAFIVACALLAAPVGAMASSPRHGSYGWTNPRHVRPAVGISTQYNKPMCGTNDWERIKTTTEEYAVSDSSGTCVSSERYHADFSVGILRNVGWQYPNIASGYVATGEPTRATDHDTGYDYPVRADEDGAPEASFGAWLNPGDYNLSFDIWFSPVKSRHSARQRAGDTEIMVWYASPGINESRAFRYYTNIDGIRFGVMSWDANHDRAWRYVAYVAVSGPGTRLHRHGGTGVSFSGIWLNQFFRDSERHGWLRKTEWLWAIDLGFELNRGGNGNNVHGYVLRHVG